MVLDEVGLTKHRLNFQHALPPRHFTKYEARINSPVYCDMALSCPEQEVFRWVWEHLVLRNFCKMCISVGTASNAQSEN